VFLFKMSTNQPETYWKYVAEKEGKDKVPEYQRKKIFGGEQ
jgi:hypothetical protein